MTFLLVLAVRGHVQDLVALRLVISIFKEFSDVFRLASSTTYAPFVDDPKSKFLDFIG